MSNFPSYSISLPVLRTDDEKEAIFQTVYQTRPQGKIWIFGYGSLMWKPACLYQDSKIGVLKGYHRAYSTWSVRGRGTLEKPGLMLSLKKGGKCTGMLFSLPRSAEKEELKKVIVREGRTGTLIPLWLPVLSGNEKITSLVFVLNENHPLKIPNLSSEEIVYHIATAEGVNGSCREYLFNTLETMDNLGIVDEPIKKLGQEVHSYLCHHRPD